MKNISKHTEELQKLFKRLSKDGKIEPKPVMEALDALVRGAMSYDVSDSRAADAMKAIGTEFVDLNELRVATDLEIQEMLGVRYPAIEERVAMITKSLNDIFEREHTMSLARLKTINKRDARQFVRELPDIHPFVEAYIMLMSLDGAAMPVDEDILAYLRGQEVVGEETTLQEAQRFIENHLKAEEVYEFFVLVRRAAQAEAAKRKVKS